jgi:hypothetical protein
MENSITNLFVALITAAMAHHNQTHVAITEAMVSLTKETSLDVVLEIISQTHVAITVIMASLTEGISLDVVLEIVSQTHVALTAAMASLTEETSLDIVLEIVSQIHVPITNQTKDSTGETSLDSAPTRARANLVFLTPATTSHLEAVAFQELV